MTWFGGFLCYYSSRTCGLTCEAWGWGRSSRSCYESWCETTVVRAWSKRGRGGGRGERESVRRERRTWIRWVTEWRDKGRKKEKQGMWIQQRPRPEHLSCLLNISVPLPHCLSLALLSHLTIVVLEVAEFWQLCLECCDGSLKGRVCMSGCVCVPDSYSGHFGVQCLWYANTGVCVRCVSLEGNPIANAWW